VTVVLTVFGFLVDLTTFLESDFAGVFAAALLVFVILGSGLAAIIGKEVVAPNEIRQTRATSQKRFKYIPNCLPKLLTYGMINNFYCSTAIFSNRSKNNPSI
jgi:hypothetical protein